MMADDQTLTQHFLYLKSWFLRQIDKNKFLLTGEGLPKYPSTTLYTIIRLKTAFISFGVGVFLYGVTLAAIKTCINKDFRYGFFLEIIIY